MNGVVFVVSCFAFLWSGSVHGFSKSSLLTSIDYHSRCAAFGPPTHYHNARFVKQSNPPTRSSRMKQMSTSTDITTEDDITTSSSSSLTEKGLYKRERYIATNRFAVRASSAAKFEKRWATRQSRLATLPGFRYFHLMRRIRWNNDKKDSTITTTMYDEGNDAESAFENYVSFTIWDKKSDFSAWRNGEAFKEAHGGTSIAAFLSTMVNSALILRGAPKPAFYDSLFVKTSSSIAAIAQPGTILDGWRNDVKDIADGTQTLPAECYIVMTKYYIPLDIANDFESTFLSLQQNYDINQSNIMVSTLMRRDGQAKGYVFFTFGGK
jgi:heme-degrading monooxygenase HmoA